MRARLRPDEWVSGDLTGYGRSGLERLRFDIICDTNRGIGVRTEQTTPGELNLAPFQVVSRPRIGGRCCE